MKKKFKATPIIVLLLLSGMTCSAQEFFLKEWWEDTELRFPHHYSELIGSYNDEFFFGANYTYIPSKIGFYGSFKYGIKGDWYANIGPVLRLNDSYLTNVDVQVFQGIGLKNGGIEGETGLRFGFGRDRKYGKWSLSVSRTYASGGFGWTAGMSWPIAGITAASAIIVGGVILVAYSTTDKPDLSGAGGSSSSASSSSSSNDSKSSSDCDTYLRKYAQQEARVVELLKQKEDANRYGTTMGKTQANKRLVEAQSKLKTIRREAANHHCSIPASSAETAGH